jgi:glutaredoxin 2
MGEDWLFRVLGQGYYFMNNWDKFDVTPVFYDNRTDIPLEHEPNEEIADWLDIQIRQRNYLVNPIVDYSILSEYMWKRAFNYAKQHKEEKSIENF